MKSENKRYAALAGAMVFCIAGLAFSLPLYWSVVPVLLIYISIRYHKRFMREQESKNRRSCEGSRRQSDKAYLVATLRVTEHPPTVRYMAIYSAPASGLTRLGNDECMVDITSAEGHDFEDAIRNLLRQLTLYEVVYGWVFKYIDREGRSLPRAL